MPNFGESKKINSPLLKLKTKTKILEENNRINIIRIIDFCSMNCALITTESSSDSKKVGISISIGILCSTINEIIVIQRFI